MYKDKTCLIVDDHPLVCAAIESLLNDKNHFSTIKSVLDVNSALDYIKNNNIDLLILDINFDISDGFEFLTRAKSHGYTGKSLFLSSNQSSTYSEIAMNIGANGYLSKLDDMCLIHDAIDAIMNGYNFFKSIKSQDMTVKEVKLSQREAVVFNHLIQGRSNKEISEMMRLSDKTISTYKTRILNKYNVKSLVELMNVNKSIVGL